MRIFPIQSCTLRQDDNFLTLNLGLRDEIKKKSTVISSTRQSIQSNPIQSRASRRDRDLLSSFSGSETRTRILWSDLTFWDENKSSKLLTFPEVSDLNGPTNVHANPGRPTIIKCAYDLSRIVFIIACLLIWLEWYYYPTRRKFLASWKMNLKIFNLNLKI